MVVVAGEVGQSVGRCLVVDAECLRSWRPQRSCNACCRCCRDFVCVRWIDEGAGPRINANGGDTQPIAASARACLQWPAGARTRVWVLRAEDSVQVGVRSEEATGNVEPQRKVSGRPRTRNQASARGVSQRVGAAHSVDIHHRRHPCMCCVSTWPTTSTVLLGYH